MASKLRIELTRVILNLCGEAKYVDNTDDKIKYFLSSYTHKRHTQNLLVIVGDGTTPLRSDFEFKDWEERGKFPHEPLFFVLYKFNRFQQKYSIASCQRLL